MYIVCLKDNVAVGVAMCKDIETAKTRFAVYDEIREITAEEFATMPIPSKLDDGQWIKTAQTPIVEYPQNEDIEKQPTEMEQMRADIDYIAIMTGVEL